MFFDATQIAPQSSSSPIPAGTYLAYITEASLKVPKSGAGQMLALTFEVLDGQFKGRKVWERLNIQHEKADTQRIAQSQLSAICHAINILRPTSEQDLCFKPMNIKVTVREAQGNYEASNAIKGFENANAAGAAAPAFGPGASAAPANAAPAWAKKAA